MAERVIPDGVSKRLSGLLQYLDQDPANVTLLTEVAETALAENRPDIARSVLTRGAGGEPRSSELMNLAGLAAMRENDFACAASIYESLLQTNTSDASVRFNLAWSWAMQRNLKGALALLDEQTTTTLPQAAMLHLQILHDQGEFDHAAEIAQSHLARHPDHNGLLAAVSVLALDIEDVGLARRCAERAGSHPDAMITLGILALGEQDAQAADYFRAALERNSRAPRAWVGQGLALLSRGAHADAARDLQHGAELFAEHTGSWIAAGWAHLLASNLSASRTAFETALQLDHNFSEGHGSLAVVSLLEGQMEDARRQTDTALRLDPASFSGTLARALLLERGGKEQAARTIIERALHQPIDGSGRTIAMALARYAL